jgi:putative membrane protein
MSSDADATNAANPANATEPQATVLLSGHLHPLVLLLRLLDGLRQSVFPLILGIASEPVFLAVAAVVFLLHVGQGLLRYLTFHYTLTTDELRTREGLLHRQERRIPIDRIQDLGFESTLLRRALGLAVVRIETASGQGVEAVLDSLSHADAERLRETLLAARSLRVGAVESVDSNDPAATAAAPIAPMPDPEWTVYVAQSSLLLLRGLTDLRFGAMAVAAYGAYELADQLGLLTRLQGVGDSFEQWLRGFPTVVAASLLAALVAAVLAFSSATAALGNLVAFHGFRLTLRADALSCRFGLITTRQKTLPRARIQRVRVEQTWLRRLLSVAVARADSAGAGRGVDDEAPGGYDVIVPLAPLPRIGALLPAALPGFENERGTVRRASPRLVLRLAARGAIEAIVLTAALWPAVGASAAFALLWMPVAWLLGRLAWHGLEFGLFDRHLYLRTGLIGHYRVYVPTHKVQAVSLHRGPLQRALGLAEIAVFVAGGPPTRVPDLELADAQAMLADLASRAALAAMQDWRNPAV